MATEKHFDQDVTLEAFRKMGIKEQQAFIDSLQASHNEAKHAKAEQLYLELEELGLSTSRPAAKRTVAASDGRAAPRPKYRSLKDPSITWSGRGQTAGWLKAEMEETGKPLDAFLIPA